MAGSYGRMSTAYLGVAGSPIGRAKAHIGVASSCGRMKTAAMRMAGSSRRVDTASTGMAGSATGVEELKIAGPAPQKGRAESSQGREGVSPCAINPNAEVETANKR